MSCFRWEFIVFQPLHSLAESLVCAVLDVDEGKGRGRGLPSFSLAGIQEVQCALYQASTSSAWILKEKDFVEEGEAQHRVCRVKTSLEEILLFGIGYRGFAPLRGRMSARQEMLCKTFTTV